MSEVKRDYKIGYGQPPRKRRKITKRQAIITQMVNESASANLRATKMLFDMMTEVEQKAGSADRPSLRN